MSLSDFLAHEAKIDATKPPPALEKSTQRETGHGGIHEAIIQWCNQQWPRWKFRHARTDKKTTEEIGTEDFTIFAPGGVTWHLEIKGTGGKLSPAQLAWAKELAMLGHTVHLVTSMEQFLGLVVRTKGVRGNH